jgi:hypothetical protein
MKPLHIGLLILGAALAGGVAVTMTQAPAIPVFSPAISSPSPPTVVSSVASASPAVVGTPAPKKPSPIPVAQPIARAAAPEPVYNEPPKSVIRKSKPIVLASVKPTQWAPERYVAPPAPPKSADATRQDPAAEPSSAPAPPPAHAPAPRQVTLQTGMTIAVRLDESVSRTSAGDSFQASLVEPLVVDGLAIAERGARVTGRVRVNPFLELGLATLSTSDGQRVAISTDPWKYGEGGMIAGGTVIRFRLTSRSTITEQQIAGR